MRTTYRFRRPLLETVMVGVVSMMVFLALIRTLSIEWIRNCSTSSHLNTLTRQLQPQNKTGAVASISTQCSNIGATIIEQEGNAADAVSVGTLSAERPIYVHGVLKFRC